MYSSTHFQSFLTRSRANAVSFQWTADIRLLSRLVEQTPLRYECLRSFYVVFTFRGIKLTGGYEVASDLIVLASHAVEYVAVAQFCYVYHLTTGSVSTSGGLPCLVPLVPEEMTYLPCPCQHCVPASNRCIITDIGSLVFFLVYTYPYTQYIIINNNLTRVLKYTLMAQQFSSRVTDV